MERRMDMAIDVAKVAEEKGKKLPSPLVWLIKKLIHQDFLNEFFTRGYEGVEFCSRCLEYMDVKMEVEGLDKLQIPAGAKLTFASNHPLGGVDGVALISIIGESGRDVRLMVNDFLMNIKGLAPMCTPVNKMGGQSRNLPEMTRQMYASDSDIIIFPSGKCSRRYEGQIQDPKWNKSFVKMSAESDRWIVPVHFIGRNSGRFYRISSLCEKLGLKFNFAMMLLPDELYRAQHKNFKVIFGTPIPPSEINTTDPLAEALRIRNIAYSL